MHHQRTHVLARPPCWHADGSLSGGSGQQVTELVSPKVDWREELREFVEATAKDEYSWSRPNRRFVSSGLYPAGLYSEALGDFVLLVDTFASIDQDTMSMFAAEAQAIVGTYPCKVWKVYHHIPVTHVEEWEPSDGELKLNPKERGGTSHIPALHWIEEQGLDASCVIALTDLDSQFAPVEPPWPVLWCSTGMDHAAFGRVVKVDA